MKSVKLLNARVLSVLFAATLNTNNVRAKRRFFLARIAGVDLPREKRVEAALTYIFGIGFPTSKKIFNRYFILV